MTQLNASLLPHVQSAKVPLTVPDPALLKLPEKVLQFGTGVLLRGLPDYFIDKANRQGVFNGRVVVVKSTDAGRADIFAEQNGLYTLCIRGLEKGRQVDEYSIISSISRTLSARSDWQQILACAHNEQLQVIISNTTEVGIQFKEEDIRQSPPESFPGKLTAFLYERFKAFKGSTASGMVIVPCELVVDNGNKLREIVLKLAVSNQLEKECIEWIEAHAIFCSSLVDRIVPGKPDEATTKETFSKLGYTDQLLAVSEVYRLWAIQGDERVKQALSFCQVDEGVIIEPDITTYRERKLRLLNGTHTISVGLGYLYGLETVGACMNDAKMSRFIARVMQEEIVPSVPVEEASARQFAEEVLDRFRNPFIEHLLINITLQYSSKMKMRNVQTLLNYYQKFNKAPKLFTLGFAAYLLFMKVEKEEGGKFYGNRNGSRYPITDEAAAYFYKAWQEADAADSESVHRFVQKVLSDASLWGLNLNEYPGFASDVASNLSAMLQSGIQKVVNELV